MHRLSAWLVALTLAAAGTPAWAGTASSAPVWQPRATTLAAAYVPDSGWSGALAALGRLRTGRLAGADGWIALAAGHLPGAYLQLASGVRLRQLLASAALVTHGLEARLQLSAGEPQDGSPSPVRPAGAARIETGIATGALGLSASAWAATASVAPALSWLGASDPPAGSLLLRLAEPGSAGLSLEGRRRIGELTARLGTALRWVPALGQLVPRLWASLATRSGPYTLDLGAAVDAVASAAGPPPVALAASISATRPAATPPTSRRPRRAHLVAWWEAPSDRLGLAAALEW